MWVALPEELVQGKKFRNFLRDLKISRSEAIGHLMLLWLWVARITPSGKLKFRNWEDIEIAAEWTGEPKAFFDATMKNGIVLAEDNIISFPDWKIVYTRPHNAARQRFYREKRKNLHTSPNMNDKSEKSVTTCDNLLQLVTTCDKPDTFFRDEYYKYSSLTHVNVNDDNKLSLFLCRKSPIESLSVLESIPELQKYGFVTPTAYALLSKNLPISPEILVRAIEKTDRAARPCWLYFAKVLDSLKKNAMKSSTYGHHLGPDSFEETKNPFERVKPSSKTPPQIDENDDQGGLDIK